MDGELSPEAAQRMTTHTEQCADCRKYYDQMLALRSMLQHLDDDLQIPAEYERGWRQSIRAERRVRTTRRVTRVFSAIAAAFVLLAGVTVFNRTTGRFNPSGSLTESELSDGEALILTSIAESSEPDTGYSILPVETSGRSDLDVAYRSYMSDMTVAAEDVTPLYDYSAEDDLGFTTSGDVSYAAKRGYDSTSRVLRSASLTMETDEFDDDLQSIKRTVATYGGLFERNALYGEAGSRRAELQMRVPAGFLESFVEQIRSIGHVIQSEVNAQDVTSQYTDTALRLDTYRTQIKRVKELTAEAADLQEILELEQEASRLQYEIDTLTGALNGWDSQNEMSTVYVTLSEYSTVNAAFSADGFSSQVSGRFNESLSRVGGFFRDMALTAADLAPHLIWLAPLCAVCALIIRYWRRRKYS